MSDLSDDDALAAEYVIGTLDDAERNAADRRRRNDAPFDQLVEDWTRWLSPLLETLPEVEPDGRVREAVMAEVDRLRSTPAALRDGSQVIQLRRQLRTWRVAATLTTALAAMLALWVARAELQPARSTEYLAVLQQGADAPVFLASLDLDHRRMIVVPSGATAQSDKSFELWMIGSDSGGPQSLGLLDAAGPVRTSLPDVGPDVISKATYAVTLEQKGGSPTGKPSSAPVYVGRLVLEQR